VRLAWFAVEVVRLDETSNFGADLLFWDSLANENVIVRNVDEWTFSKWFLLEFVVVNLIESKRAAFDFIINLGFLDECIDDILYRSIFWNENIMNIL